MRWTWTAAGRAAKAKPGAKGAQLVARTQRWSRLWLRCFGRSFCQSSAQIQFVAHLNIPSENKCKFIHGKHTHPYIGHRHALLLLLPSPPHFPNSKAPLYFALVSRIPWISRSVQLFQHICINFRFSASIACRSCAALLLFTLFMSQEFNIFSNYFCCFSRTCFVVQLSFLVAVHTYIYGIVLPPKDWKQSGSQALGSLPTDLTHL